MRTAARNTRGRNTGARALVAALAVGATLGGWALIAHDAQVASTTTIDPVADSALASNAATLRLEPLPTVESPPGNLDEIYSSQLAPADSSALQAAPLFTLPRETMLQPLARSRSSN